MRIHAIFVLFLGALVPHLALADTPESEEEIVVTATRTARIADETMASVIVITREQIELSQAIDVAELLKFHAGLDIGRNGGAGQATSIFIRGTESNHALVMVDGVKINPGTIGGAALQNIDPDMIERIEIVKGPRSSLYGSEAIGGVIQIFTRKTMVGTRFNAFATTGSYRTSKVSAGVSTGSDTWKTGLQLSGFVTEGFPALEGQTENSGNRNMSLNAFLTTRIGGVDTELRTWLSQGNTEYYDFFATPVDQDFLNDTTSLTLKGSLNDRTASTLRIGQARDFIDQNQSVDFAHTRRLTADWQNDIQSGNNGLLTAGLYLSKEFTNAESFGTSFNEEVDDNAVYAQYQLDRDRQQYLIGGRYTQNSAFGGHPTGNFSYGYRLSKKMRVFAALGSAFRAPDSTDRFGFGGNPALEPETSQNLEFGTHYRISGKSSVKAAAFYNRIDNLIVYDTGTSLNQNIDLAVIPGVEVEYNRTYRQIDYLVSGILQDPINVTTGKQLARRAKQSLTLSATYKRPAYQFGFDLLATGDRPDSDFSSIVNPAYVLINAHASYQLTRRWVLQGRLENLLDTDYVLANGYNTPGRSIYIQLRYEGSNKGRST
ncbi:MAG: TonB-dependent receptor domain-containing protein [Acidiferrobacterales bacterium]